VESGRSCSGKGCPVGIYPWVMDGMLAAIVTRGLGRWYENFVSRSVSSVLMLPTLGMF
jgi:hypothetical protein